jgi:hypothetical protein
VNGREHLLIAPLSGASQNRRINELDLLADTDWAQKMVRTVERAYRRAPRFQQVFPLIRDILTFSDRKLAAYLVHGLEAIKSYLNIASELVPTSVGYKNAELKGEKRILDICRQTGATMYLNPKGGREIYDSASFSEQKIALRFLESDAIEYKQLSSEFHPWLSIVDVLMCNSRNEAKDHISRVELRP